MRDHEGAFVAGQPLLSESSELLGMRMCASGSLRCEPLPNDIGELFHSFYLPMKTHLCCS
jgi:hypothetical protein